MSTDPTTAKLRLCPYCGWSGAPHTDCERTYAAEVAKTGNEARGRAAAIRARRDADPADE